MYSSSLYYSENVPRQHELKRGDLGTNNVPFETSMLGECHPTMSVEDGLSGKPETP